MGHSEISVKMLLITQLARSQLTMYFSQFLFISLGWRVSKICSKETNFLLVSIMFLFQNSQLIRVESNPNRYAHFLTRFPALVPVSASKIMRGVMAKLIVRMAVMKWLVLVASV